MFSYWDTSYDDDLMEDHVAMNLLFIQVIIQSLSVSITLHTACDSMCLTMFEPVQFALTETKT